MYFVFLMYSSYNGDGINTINVPTRFQIGLPLFIDHVSKIKSTQFGDYWTNLSWRVKRY